MNNIDSKLKLSYSPMTVYEFKKFKTDEDIRGYLNLTTIYVIAKRKLPLMKLIKANSSGFQIVVKMEGIKNTIEIVMRKEDNPNLLSGLVAIGTGSNLKSDSEYFHSITLYRDKNGEKEFILNANFDRLIHLSSNKIINIHIKGDISPFVSYEVLYVGQCTGEHIYDRFKSHHGLQDILIEENIIQPNYDKVNDLMILPFHIESDVVSCITSESTESEFIKVINGEFSFGINEISLDCEKALVHAMNPKYNKTRFKHYPKSTNGLFNHNLDSYLYRILENVILCYDCENKIYGDVDGISSSSISIIGNRKFDIFY